MSTQDDTLYLRSKLATRRNRVDYGGPGGQWSSSPQFMKDGFQTWAESTRPAREGGSEKIPAEKQMPRHGRGVIEDAIKVVSDMTDFYHQAKEYTPKVKAVLRDKDLQQKIAKGKYAPIMEKIATYMEKVGLGHLRNDEALVRKVGGSKSFKQWCGEEEREHHGGRIGMGKKHDSIEHHIAECLQGGMSASEALASLKKYGKAVYDWLKANKTATKAILESPFLNEKNPLGATDLPRKIKGYMEKVGLGATEDAEKLAEEYLRKAVAKKPVRWGMGATEDAEEHLRNTVAKKPALWGMGVAEDVRENLRKAVSKRFGKGVAEDVRENLRKAVSKRFGGGVAEDVRENLRKAVSKRFGGRAPSAYALFVKQFAAKHPGPDLMRRAASAWKSR